MQNRTELITDKLKHSNIICSCEGSAERAIISILLKHGVLLFTEDDLVNSNNLGIRGAKNIEETYLRTEYPDDKPAIVVRICDSRTEGFKLSKVYNGQIDVYSFFTRPEIESLIILNERRWDDYQKYKSDTKPNEYCKRELKMTQVKSYQFICEYFKDYMNLVYAIKEYKRVMGTDKEYNLFHLLNTETQCMV